MLKLNKNIYKFNTTEDPNPESHNNQSTHPHPPSHPLPPPPPRRPPRTKKKKKKKNKKRKENENFHRPYSQTPKNGQFESVPHKIPANGQYHPSTPPRKKIVTLS